MKLIYGDGDVVKLCRDMLELAEAGRIEAISVAYADDQRGLFHAWAYKDDAPTIWARLVAAIGSLYHDLMSNGL